MISFLCSFADYNISILANWSNTKYQVYYKCGVNISEWLTIYIKTRAIKSFCFKCKTEC